MPSATLELFDARERYFDLDPLRNDVVRCLKRLPMPSFSKWSCISMSLLSLYVGGSLYILSPPLDTSPLRGTWSPQTPIVDSIVFIAVGPASQSTSLLYALQSLREEGEWTGPVHVIVEHENDLDCVSKSLGNPPIPIVADMAALENAPSSPNGGQDAGSSKGAIAHAKMAKMQLLDLLPGDIKRVLYMDCDILVERPIRPFLELMGREWAKLGNETAKLAGSTAGQTPSDAALQPVGGTRGIVRDRGVQELATSSLLIFPDAGGHTMPLCSGCDKAHSGVVGLERGRSERCLRLWLKEFAGDKGTGKTGTSTDQEALDLVLKKGTGCEARWLDTHHIRFMKDIFVVMGFVKKRTFAHFTGLLHPERISRTHRRHYERELGKSFDEWGSNGGALAGCSDGDSSPPHR